MPKSNAAKGLAAMTDDQLEQANQALMRERAVVLARQRDIAAEVDRRAKRQRVEYLEAELAAEHGRVPRSAPASQATEQAFLTQELGVGDVASAATVLGPGRG